MKKTLTAIILIAAMILSAVCFTGCDNRSAKELYLDAIGSAGKLFAEGTSAIPSYKVTGEISVNKLEIRGQSLIDQKLALTGSAENAEDKLQGTVSIKYAGEEASATVVFDAEKGAFAQFSPISDKYIEIQSDEILEMMRVNRTNTQKADELVKSVEAMAQKGYELFREEFENLDDDKYDVEKVSLEYGGITIKSIKKVTLNLSMKDYLKMAKSAFTSFLKSKEFKKFASIYDEMYGGNELTRYAENEEMEDDFDDITEDIKFDLKTEVYYYDGESAGLHVTFITKDSDGKKDDGIELDFVKADKAFGIKAIAKDYDKDVEYVNLNVGYDGAEDGSVKLVVNAVSDKYTDDYYYSGYSSRSNRLSGYYELTGSRTGESLDAKLSYGASKDSKEVLAKLSMTSGNGKDYEGTLKVADAVTVGLTAKLEDNVIGLGINKVTIETDGEKMTYKFNLDVTVTHEDDLFSAEVGFKLKDDNIGNIDVSAKITFEKFDSTKVKVPSETMSIEEFKDSLDEDLLENLDTKYPKMAGLVKNLMDTFGLGGSSYNDWEDDDYDWEDDDYDWDDDDYDWDDDDYDWEDDDEDYDW